MPASVGLFGQSHPVLVDLMFLVADLVIWSLFIGVVIVSDALFHEIWAKDEDDDKRRREGRGKK